MTATDDSLGEDIVQDLVGALVPAGSALGKRIYRAVTAEHRRNRSIALRAAVRASGLSREDFAEWIEREPRAIPLYLKVLWAAGMNGHEKTLRAMGAVLGAAARATQRGDEGDFEDAELALRAMSELTEKHFHVLHAICSATVRINDDRGGKNYIEFVPSRVARAAGVRDEVANQCLLNLAGAGLALSFPVLEDIAYTPTDLGHAVVQAAAAAAGTGRRPEDDPSGCLGD